jgi:hypothetical protein
MNINRDKLRRVGRVLGARTDTEAVDLALGLVLANSEIEAAIEALAGKLPDFQVS